MFSKGDDREKVSFRAMTITSIYQRRAEVDMLGQAKRNFGNEIYKARETGIKYMCDLCDKKTPFEHLHRIGGGVYLCPKCQKIISSMGRGKVKNNVMRFLMRNVI
jgi:ribosomal protein L37AE/L43A